jgi:hypothetical protein
MTLTRLLTLIERLVTLVILVASGVYLLVYVYRWEWNRALLSGVFFLAAEFALGTALILRRMRALADQLAERDSASPLVLSQLHRANADRSHPFRWLERTDRMSVFVPVLIGAGAIVSAIAYLVEHLAEATAGHTVDRLLARRLGTLAPHRRQLAPDRYAGSMAISRRTFARLVVAGIGVAVVATLGVQLLMDATQSRPDASERPARTTIELRIEDKRPRGSLVDTTNALYAACQRQVPSKPPVTAAVSAAGDGRVRIDLQPGIRRLMARRLTGCLSDATLEYVSAEVVAVRSTPR